MAAGPVFPGFIRVEYKTDGSAKSKFLAEAAQLSGEVKKPFSEAFDQIGKMVDRVSGKFRDGNFKLEVDVTTLREASAKAEFTAAKLAALRDAALSIAGANKDQSASTLAFTKGLQVQAAEAERASQAARDQLTAYTNLQAALDTTARKNDALAKSYRDLAIAQGRQLADSQTTRLPTQKLVFGADALVSGQGSLDRAAVSGVKLEQVLGRVANKGKEVTAALREAAAAADKAANVEVGPKRANPGPTNARSGADALVAGKASLDRAALSGARLEDVLGRVATKGKEVTAALREAAIAAEKAAAEQGKALNGPKPANAAPQSTRFGADALVAGQASLDKAAISATTLEQVLGRVANKGREVGAALAEAERAAADAAKEREAAEAAASAAAEKVKAQASDELKRLAEAADTLNARLNPAIGIQQRYNNEIENARNLLKAGVIDQNLYAQAVQSAAEDQASALKVLEAAQEQANQSAKRGTSEQQNVINSIRSQRVAFVQLGQQMQDVVVQAQMGTSAITIFSQQVPQAAFALSGLEGNANETLDKVGEFATFLSGPWGAALFAATAFLGPLVFEVLGFGNAADEAKGKTYDFTNGLDGLVLSANEATSAFAQLSKEISSAISLQGDFLKSRAIAAEQGKREFSALYQREQAELKVLKDRVTDLNPFNDLNPGEIYRMNTLAANQTRLKGIIDEAGIGVSNSRIALAQQRALEAADPRAAIEGRYRRQVGELEKRFRRSIDAGNDPLAKATGQDSLTDAEYQSELTRLTIAKDKEIDALKKTRTRKGPDAGKEAERAARAAQRLGEFGEDAGKKIANIRDSFSAIPPEVERINKASRELDDIISDLMNRKPEGFEALKSEAEALKASLADGVVTQALDGMAESADRQLKIQELLLSGRDADAAALQNIWAIEEKIGSEEELRTKAQALILQGRTEEAAVLTRIANQYPRIRSEVQAIADAEQKRIEAMRKAQEMQQVFLDATRDVRSEVEGILGGYRSLGDLGATLRRSFQQIQGKILTEQIFGDMFRDLDRYVKEQTGIGSSVDMLKTETERAGDAAGTLADELLGAARRISTAGTGATAAAGFGSSSILGGWGNIGVPPLLRKPANENYDPNGPIVVTANKPGAARRVMDLTPEEFFRKMGQDVGAKWAAQLEPLLGKKFAGNIGGVIGGILEGQATTGTGFGAILGGLKELKGLPDALSEALGSAFAGAQAGAQIAGLGNSLGLGMSNTGAQIGAAIGTAVFGPAGGIAGALAGGMLKKIGSTGAGGILGLVLSKVSKGYAVASNGGVTTGGNRTQAANSGSAANSLNDSLSTIARAFGSSLGNYAVSIGTRSSGYIRVSASGSTRVGDKSFAKNGGSDLLYDGKDMQEALRIALKNAIEDGAIQGIKAGTKRLLSIGSNIDAQVEKALKFEKVFKDLKQIKDPVGFALDELNTEFKGLIDVFKEAGASAQEMAQLEELYGIRRKEAIKQATEAALGPIKSLLDSLNIGSEFYSLRDRQASAQAIYNPLAQRVAAGDMTAYAEFSDAAQSLIEINRQIYGSTSQFFDFVDQVKALSQGTLDREQAKIDAATASDSPFTQLAAQQQATTSAIDAQTEALIAAIGGRLDTMNSNLIAALRAAAANNNTVQYTGLFAPGGAW